MQTEFCVAKALRQLVHLVADGLVDDPGVDLRRAEFRVAEHLADRLDRDTVGIGDRRCKSMPGKVRGNSFLNTVEFGQFFQIEVVLRIAHHGKQEVAVAFKLVLSDNRQRNVEQLDFRSNARFNTMRLDPETAVVIRHQILLSQGGRHRVIVACETAEQEDVAHLFEPFTVGREVDDPFKLGFGQVAAIFLDLFERVSAEGSRGI